MDRNRDAQKQESASPHNQNTMLINTPGKKFQREDHLIKASAS